MGRFWLPKWLPLGTLLATKIDKKNDPKLDCPKSRSKIAPRRPRRPKTPPRLSQERPKTPEIAAYRRDSFVALFHVRIAEDLPRSESPRYAAITGCRPRPFFGIVGCVFGVLSCWLNVFNGISKILRTRVCDPKSSKTTVPGGLAHEMVLERCEKNTEKS